MISDLTYEPKCPSNSSKTGKQTKIKTKKFQTVAPFMVVHILPPNTLHFQLWGPHGTLHIPPWDVPMGLCTSYLGNLMGLIFDHLCFLRYCDGGVFFSILKKTVAIWIQLREKGNHDIASHGSIPFSIAIQSLLHPGKTDFLQCCFFH